MEYLINEIQEEELTSRGDYYSIALFNDTNNGVIGIEFQRGVGGIYGHPDTGTPPYCVVTSEACTYYGGVERVRWTSTSIEIDFTPEAQDSLNLPQSHLSLDLDLRTEDLVRAKAGLQRVFGPGDFAYDQPELIGFG
jgi:hypothetical protein